MTTPKIFPRPPVNEVPPNTTMVITSNNKFSPILTLPLSVFEVRPKAPIQERMALKQMQDSNEFHIDAGKLAGLNIATYCIETSPAQCVG